MGRLRIGDIVARKSYGSDILFKVVDISNNGKENIAILKGISYRIQADALESDLVLQTDMRINEHRSSLNKIVDKKCRDILSTGHNLRSKKAFYRDTPKDSVAKFSSPGRVLHIDGDSDYLDTCLDQYKKFEIVAIGKHVPEKDQPSAIYRLLQEHKPDILVLTGHDGVVKGESGYQDINNYKNSKSFVEAVKEARRYDRNMDSLVIFAGACQSMYKEILKAGANYASAPYRVLIHALDPVFICQKVAYTSVDRVVPPTDVINATITGYEGIGGVQTRGKYRDGYPKEPY